MKLFSKLKNVLKNKKYYIKSLMNIKYEFIMISFPLRRILSPRRQSVMSLETDINFYNEQNPLE